MGFGVRNQSTAVILISLCFKNFHEFVYLNCWFDSTTLSSGHDQSRPVKENRGEEKVQLQRQPNASQLSHGEQRTLLQHFSSSTM